MDIPFRVGEAQQRPTNEILLPQRSERWRYVRYAEGSEELYDHAVDPHEWENLAMSPTHAAVKAELLRQMRALAGDAVAP